MMWGSVLVPGWADDADEFDESDEEFVFELDEADDVDEVDKRVALGFGFKSNSSRTVFGVIMACCCWITRLDSFVIVVSLLFSLDLILLIFLFNNKTKQKIIQLTN